MSCHQSEADPTCVTFWNVSTLHFAPEELLPGVARSLCKPRCQLQPEVNRSRSVLPRADQLTVRTLSAHFTRLTEVLVENELIAEAYHVTRMALTALGSADVHSSQDRRELSGALGYLANAYLLLYALVEGECPTTLPGVAKSLASRRVAREVHRDDELLSLDTRTALFNSSDAYSRAKKRGVEEDLGTESILRLLQNCFRRRTAADFSIASGYAPVHPIGGRTDPLVGPLLDYKDNLRPLLVLVPQAARFHVLLGLSKVFIQASEYLPNAAAITSAFDCADEAALLSLLQQLAAALKTPAFCVEYDADGSGRLVFHRPLLHSDMPYASPFWTDEALTLVEAGVRQLESAM
ncbi:MAG: uncharacterized protein KVP18_002719 [Porospora cf. gigantea A]|uniref:uncharacterized protein n=1 Tax=Porospora cf. gigantea A TaxID=2853593 RepID=UPI003559C250|nr:MAG: hypothetical protein KVP18_002719 [Porospora cf. gigantea A]